MRIVCYQDLRREGEGSAYNQHFGVVDDDDDDDEEEEEDNRKKNRYHHHYHDGGHKAGCLLCQ